MSLEELGIEHKTFEDTLVAAIRANVRSRDELFPILDRLTEAIPGEYVAGPAFCTFQFISSYEEGFDAEICMPVTRAVESGEVQTRLLPSLEVLSLVHEGPIANLRESSGKLFGYAAEHALISDEFYREVYLDLSDPEKSRIEVQFVIHNWNRLLAENLGRVLGRDAQQTVMEGSEALGLESNIDERYAWVRGAMDRLDGLASDEQRFEIVSRCAHIFPKEPIERAGQVYRTARAKVDDPLLAIDAVIEFMDRDPAWGIRPVREGYTIYATKNPRDPKGYAEAQTAAERRRAYCFCPLIRDHLEDGTLSDTFCYCSSGWERQQWEGAIGQPVRVEVVKSLLRGDDCCQFAIQLPVDL
jgi:effector-binding domain-containing protein